MTRKQDDKHEPWEDMTVGELEGNLGAARAALGRVLIKPLVLLIAIAMVVASIYYFTR